MSDPQLLNPANLDASFIVPLIILALVLVAAWFLVIGYSMKFALSIVGAGRFGFWKSMLIVLLAGGTASIVSTTLMMISPGDPFMALLGMVAAVIVYCLVVSMIAQCGFGKSFLAYLLNGVFNLLGAVPVIVLLVLGMLTVRQIADPDGSKVKQWQAELAQLEGAGVETSDDAFAVTEVANAARSEAAGGTQDSGRTQAIRGGTQALPQHLPPVIDQSNSSRSGGGFFGWGAKAADTPYPGFDAGKECRSGCAKNRATPTKLPAAAAAAPGAPQANPFAK